MALSARNKNIACLALLVSILALQVPSVIDKRGTSAGTTTAAAVTAASPPLFDDGALKAVVAMLALGGMDALLIAAAVIYSRSRHTHHAAAAAAIGARGGNRRVTRLAFFVFCLQVGVLQLVLFVQEPAAAAGALVISAASRALPCVASVTFFLGITLVYAHVGNGGGGGGAAGGAVAGNGPAVLAPAAIRLLADMTLGAALVCLMSTTLALFYNKTK